MKIIQIPEEAAYAAAVEEVLAELGTRKLILLIGEMGAGKTTFVRYLMDYLGGDPASSPTYALVNEYITSSELYPVIYHMDLYRLRHEEEVMALPLAEYLDSGNLCIIEWPQIAMPFIQEDFLELNIEVLADGKRNFVLL